MRIELIPSLSAQPSRETMSDVTDDDVWIDSNTKALNADTLEMTPAERPTVARPDASSLAQSDSGRLLGYPLTNDGTTPATFVQGSTLLYTTLPLSACHRMPHSVLNTNTRPSPCGMRDSRQHRLAHTETHPAVGATDHYKTPECVQMAVSDDRRSDRAETTLNSSSAAVSQQIENACECL